MFKVTITSIKINQDIEFWQGDEDFEDYVYETYIAVGKIISVDTACNDDGMKKVCTINFIDRESWNTFIKDPIIMYQEKIKLRYNNYHRIAMSVNTENTPITKDLYSLYRDGINPDFSDTTSTDPF